MTSEALLNPGDVPRHEQGAHKAIRAYCIEHVAAFRRLQELRAKGWASSKGDLHFKTQRRTADGANDKTARFFYRMMRDIGDQMDAATGSFNFSHIDGDPAILDMCIAPGGFVAALLDKYPAARIRAMSLSPGAGGHEVLLKSSNLDFEFVDITMLAADMDFGECECPAAHPGAGDFLYARRFDPHEKFDLVFCDGQVLRTQIRAQWRELREARRLTLTQLALGLEHMREGGTMVILLHKLEAWHNLQLLHLLDSFSNIQLFKSTRSHATRSSFYVIAQNIQVSNVRVAEAISIWKQQWKIANFGSDDEYWKTFRAREQDAMAILETFGETFVRIGKPIWEIQANALNQAPYMR